MVFFNDNKKESYNLSDHWLKWEMEQSQNFI